MYIVNITGDINANTLDLIDNAISQPDNDVLLRIDSQGGSLYHGMLAYDRIRESGKNFSANVYGVCMSSATLLLVACPIGNRTASAHATILIHNPLVNLGYSSLNDVKSMLGTMEDAKQKLVQIYAERTLMSAQEVSELMDAEKELYATDCVEKGLINNTNALLNKVGANYNKKIKRNTMRKSFIETLCNKMVKALLKNEIIVAEDGSEVNIEGEIAVGTPASPDGIFVIDGATVTIEGGSIVDIIPAEQPEPETIENEGETEEPTVEPEQIAEEVAETVEEVVADEEVTDATEIAEIVKEVVEEQMTELAELKELVEKCGGKKKLQNLAKVKHQAKVFNTTPTTKIENKQRSIKELMGLKRK